MPPNINWNNIRPINGSQKEGFEELVCQLARNEKIENAKSFVRKGSPDAGVECFWILNDESEISWQAKYFTSPLTSTQWSEIDKSVKTAIKKHPKIKKYIISIPQDRADARVPGQKSFLQKWEGREKKWKLWAKEKGLSIHFEYEGSSELLSKLSWPENIGKTLFWFDKNEFSIQWFKNQNENKIKDLSSRYSPEVNVDLKIKYIFDGIYNNPKFIKKIATNLEDFETQFQRYLVFLKQREYDSLFDDNKKLYQDYLKVGCELDVISTKSYRKSSELFKDVERRIRALVNVFLSETDISIIKEEGVRTLRKESQKVVDSALINGGDSLLLDSRLAENPLLLIEGEGGIGKSHLIASIIEEKHKEEQLSILLLGQHFNKGDIWSQVLSELGLNLTKEEFLGALNAKAESIGSRIVMYIDAINEGDGKLLWKNRLLGFIDDFRKYPNLGLVLSIRSTYKDMVLPEGIYELVEHFKHRGFENNAIAIKTFFDYYRINEPPIPFIDPEFSNPLFLKLFCKGLFDNGLQNIPDGYEGITTIFEFVVKAANKSISERLDYDCKMYNLVNEAIKILIDEIISSTSFSVYKSVAYNLLTEKLKDHVKNSRNVLTELINENIIHENAYYNHQTQKYDNEIVYFSYEMFGDHLIADALLGKEESALKAKKSINQESSIYPFVSTLSSFNSNQGMVEALSIQLPEKFQIELYEIMPSRNDIPWVGQAFLHSLVWRKKNSIDKKVLEYINGYTNRVKSLNKQFKNALVQLSIRKGHFFNSSFLDGLLHNMNLIDRDSYWTLYINESEGEMPSTLIEWVKESRVIRNMDTEIKKLLSITLVWFLTSSDRELRDKTTKALVLLFENDFDSLRDSIEHFKDVNDIYVLERLYAVAYGVVVRAQSIGGLTNFATYIYNSVFIDKVPPEHLLLRDYAKGIVDYVYRKGLVPDIDISVIQPPYGSKMPSEIPSEQYIKKYDIDRDGESITQNELFDYVMGFSDFARYTIGTNGFSKISLVTIESREAYTRLYNSLKKEDRKGLESIFDIVKFFNSEKLSADYKSRFQESYAKVFEDLQLFFDISDEEAKLIKEYMLNSAYAESIKKEKRFNLNHLQRLIIKDVFEESKWSLTKFNEYDRRRFNPFAKKSFSRKEAIGKKYVWIAYYKWLSIIFDTYLIETDYNSEEEWDVYKGSWSPFERDIDPTMLMEVSIDEEIYKREEFSFWSPRLELNFEQSCDEVWVMEEADFVDPKQMIEVKNGEVTWLNLLSYPSWNVKENEVDGNERQRDVWYHIKSYLVKKENKNEIIVALENKSFWNHSIPQTQQIYELFSREYYWSEGYEKLIYDEDSNLLHESFSNKESLKGFNTSKQFTWYDDRDFSLKGAIHISRPSKLLFDIMNAELKEEEHRFYDKVNGELIITCPAIDEQRGFDCLLVRKDRLLDKLEENGLDILWCVLGAKEVISSHKIIHESRINSVFHFDDNAELVGDFELIRPKIR